MFQPTIALAKIRMGSRTLTIGQVERLEVANKYFTENYVISTVVP